jgi:hypothetical protein
MRCGACSSVDLAMETGTRPGLATKRPLILARVASIPAGRPVLSPSRARTSGRRKRTVRTYPPANRHRGLDLYGPGTCMPPPAVLPICVSAVAARGVMHGEAGPIPPYAAASRARVQQRCNRGQRHGRATDSGTSGGCCAVAGHGPYALTIKLA